MSDDLWRRDQVDLESFERAIDVPDHVESEPLTRSTT
jgi:hypothetical protein